MSTTSVISERRVRREATKQGYRVWKVREGSRWFWEYGPFSLIDGATSGIVQRGLTLEEIHQFLIRLDAEQP